MPYTDPSYARLLTSYQAYELAELARAAVPIAAHEQHPDDGTPATAGAVLADAVRILTAAHRLVEAAVVYERLGGADWRLIGAHLDLPAHTARERFATAEARLRERPHSAERREALPDEDRKALPDAPWWHTLTRTEPLDAPLDAALEAALDLDDWVLRHGSVDGDDPGTAPVSRGLTRRRNPR